MVVVERRRLFAPPETFREDGLLLEGERLRHVRAVLRLREGDELDVTDGAGMEYRVRIEWLGRDAGRAGILGRTRPSRESPLRTVLAQAVPKGDRFALVLEKAVELGVGAVIPVVSERTVPAGGGGVRSVARWRRVAEAATAQSGRTRLTEVQNPRTFRELLDDPLLPELRLLLWEQAESGLRETLRERPAPAAVLVVVGPEGGFSREETERARSAGVLIARLGPRTLRTETAGLAALAALQHRWGDLG